jgi:two-component system NtrC family sensor kinase
VLLVVSLLPLALVGVGASAVFRDMLLEETLELQRNMVQGRAAAIDLYLDERIRGIEIAARLFTLEQWSDHEKLQRIFDALSRSYPDAFVDLGVIGADGTHLAYLGPYDLKDRNYADAEWFRSVLENGSYVSDVFLGYRGVPHSVIAVRRKEGAQTWVVRATINNVSLYSIVRGGEIGASGDVFLVDARGRYQTPPREGDVLGLSSIERPVPHQGVRNEIVDVDGGPFVRTTTWLNDGRWLLVVQKAKREVLEPVRRASTMGALVILVAMGLVALTTFLATWHLTTQIDRAHAQRDELSRELLRSAKLASVGELATGLAHEINNPLAIISAEQTNLDDVISEHVQDPPVRGELKRSLDRCKRQVERCAGITSKMLRFGRRSDTRLAPTAIGDLILESASMMRKQAHLRNVSIAVDVEPGLPPIVLDGTELEQVLVNLITNAMQAIEGSGSIAIAARRAGEEVLLSVRDDGRGIASDDLDHIFQPFFTTKPVGQGTGLGLPVCYGIVRSWGGRIEVSSRIGAGATFTIHLPVGGAERSTDRARPGSDGEAQEQWFLQREELR